MEATKVIVRQRLASRRVAAVVAHRQRLQYLLPQQGPLLKVVGEVGGSEVGVGPVRCG